MQTAVTKTFEELECWKACRELRMWVRDSVVRLLPKEEKFLLADQLIRASRSATANIAEGYGRYHFMDNAKFCRNARGSCFEVLDHLIVAKEENYLTGEDLEEGRELVYTAVRTLNGYIAFLNRSSQEAKS